MRGQLPIQDEFTHRTDLTNSQKYWRRKHPGRIVRARPTGTLEEVRARVDLGLALVSLVAIPGVPLTLEDIAAWCGCTRENIRKIERDALKKIRNTLFFRDRETWDAFLEYLTEERQPARRSQRSTPNPQLEAAA